MYRLRRSARVSPPPPVQRQQTLLFPSFPGACHEPAVIKSNDRFCRPKKIAGKVRETKDYRAKKALPHRQGPVLFELPDIRAHVCKTPNTMQTHSVSAKTGSEQAEIHEFQKQTQPSKSLQNIRMGLNLQHKRATTSHRRFRQVCPPVAPQALRHRGGGGTNSHQPPGGHCAR